VQSLVALDPSSTHRPVLHYVQPTRCRVYSPPARMLALYHHQAASPTPLLLLLLMGWQHEAHDTQAVGGASIHSVSSRLTRTMLLFLPRSDLHTRLRRHARLADIGPLA
jgi:hypothetical protein